MMNHYNQSQELVLYTLIILFLLIISFIVLNRFYAKINVYSKENDKMSDELVEVKNINFNLRSVIKSRDEDIENLESVANRYITSIENKINIKDLQCINEKLNNQVSDLLYQLDDEKAKALWLSKQGIKGDLLTYLENYRNLLKKKAIGSSDFNKISKEYNNLFSETKVITIVKDISITLNYLDPVRIGTLSNKEINKNITALKRLVFKL